MTITKFFVEPLEHIGGAISKFFKATLQDLPVYMWPVVLISILIILTLFLVIMQGYRVNILGPLLGIEPVHQPVQHAPIQHAPVHVHEIQAGPVQPAIQAPQISHQEMHQNIQNSIQQGLEREV